MTTALFTADTVNKAVVNKTTVNKAVIKLKTQPRYGIRICW